MKKKGSSTLFEVGYRKPPVHTRFQPGHSGNPKGRPKGATNVSTLVKKTLLETVEVVVHGKRKRISKLEAAFTQLANKAAQGDPRAMQQVLSLTSLIEMESSSSAAPLDADEAAVMQQLLGRLASSQAQGEGEGA